MGGAGSKVLHLRMAAPADMVEASIVDEQVTGGEADKGRTSRPSADPLVERMMAQAEDPVIALRGLLGRGKAEGMWRLYLSQHFDEYVDVEDSDIVASQPPRDATPLEGTVLWVRKNAHLQYTHVSSREVQADFLQGGITSGHLSRTGAATFGAVTRPETGYACTRNYVCSINPHIPACQDRTMFCGTLDCPATGALCPTGEFIEGC